MEWLFFTLIAMFCFGISNFLLKVSTLHGFDLAHLERLSDPTLLIVLVPAIVLPILGSVALMLAFKQPEAKTGLIVVIASTGVLLLVLGLSIAFLGENYSSKQLLGVGLAIAAIMLLVS